MFVRGFDRVTVVASGSEFHQTFNFHFGNLPLYIPPPMWGLNMEAESTSGLYITCSDVSCTLFELICQPILETILYVENCGLLNVLHPCLDPERMYVEDSTDGHGTCNAFRVCRGCGDPV